MKVLSLAALLGPAGALAAAPSELCRQMEQKCESRCRHSPQKVSCRDNCTSAVSECKVQSGEKARPKVDPDAKRRQKQEAQK